MGHLSTEPVAKGHMRQASGCMQEVIIKLLGCFFVSTKTCMQPEKEIVMTDMLSKTNTEEI